MKEEILILWTSNNHTFKRFHDILRARYKITSYNFGIMDYKTKNYLSKIVNIMRGWVIAFRLCLTSKADKVIFGAGPLTYLVPFLWMVKNKEIITFKYDIDHFRPPTKKDYFFNILHKLDLWSEKYVFLNSNKIIHKGLNNELELLPFYEKIKHKPDYLFREFLDPKLIPKKKLPKLSEKDGEIHLVYTGGLYLTDLPDTESFWKFYPKITKQKMHLHIYSKQPKHIMDRFREIEKHDRYFHYEGFREHKKLIRELTKYDYGIHLFGNGTSRKNELITKIAFSNKNFDYVSAGLPIIVSNNLMAVAEFVKANNIGIIINYKEVDNLKRRLVHKKAKSFSVDNFIRRHKNNHEFLDFILNG